MRVTLWLFCCNILIINRIYCLPVTFLYDHNVPEAIELPKENDVSSPEVHLKVPLNFYGTRYESLYINSNGLISFQTEIPNFFNIEFPLDYPLIAPFYTNVDIRTNGKISYYETDNPKLIERATDDVRENFVNEANFQAISLFIVTWYEVGYYNNGTDKLNTYQVIIITDGNKTFIELLYPQNGIQWIQGTGDDSGLPDARAQVGFISNDGRIYSLPGSGTEQVRHLETLSNTNLDGQFLYRVDGDEIIEPDINYDDNKIEEPERCTDAPTFCHVQANCVDYDEGFCCKCKQQYYGNGKFCIKKDVPLRVNGKIEGKINGEKLENLDLQSYIVMSDGRAYTAISKIPESIGFDIQSLQILGGVIGYVFAKPIRNALNGYQLTGGVFNHTATIKFLNTTQELHIKQKYIGLDVFDQLKLEAYIQGDIPTLPYDSRIVIDEYHEQYTQTSPDTIQTTSTRNFKYLDDNDKEVIHYFTVEQTFVFDYCKYDNESFDLHTWKLKVGKNFISYEAKEQIIRFGLSNKITPLGEIDPCEEGRIHCGPNSACVVVDNDNYRCVCNPGYQQIYTPDSSELICTDIDECQSGLHSCDYNAQCHNEIGTYSCTCNPGFEGNGHVCENARSCNNVQCPQNSECIEINQIAMCKCSPGFSGDGQICTPIQDYSCHKQNNCAEFGLCTINRDTNQYYCACLPGYTGDGYICNKIEEESTTVIIPTTTPIIVASTQTTIPKQCLMGLCWCPDGYRQDPNSDNCIDEGVITTTETSIDEGNVEILGNEVETQCYNTTLCFCPTGFHYDKPTNSCKFPVNSKISTKGYSGINFTCNVLDICHPDATCVYSETTDIWGCVCNLGYEGDGIQCKLRAACINDDDCTITEKCELSLTTQRYECVCKDGYIRDTQYHCVQQFQTCGGGTCVENAECLFDDEYQIHYCSCKAGYQGDGISECRPKPAGCDTLKNCDLNAVCVYNASTTLYQCKCNPGHTGDGLTCRKDINCHNEPSLCHPYATCVTNTNHSYICQCNPGYIGNGTSCKLQEFESGFLLLNQGMATLRIPYEPNKSNPGKPIQVKYYQTAVGLDIDCLKGRVYWSDITGQTIRSSNYNGSSKIEILNNSIGSPEGLAVDWVSRNLYWTDSTKDTIEILNIDKKRRRILIDTGLVNPRGIAVHPQRGKLFWTDWDRKNPKIEWSNTDGTDRQIFLQGPAVSLPNSLMIDYEMEQLCYTDAGTKKIECVHIDSKHQRTIATNCTYPFGIAVTDKYIYWSDWISKKIERVDKFTLERLPSLPVPLGGSGNKLFGLVAVPKRCPQLTNVCQFYKDQCAIDHICVPDGRGSRRCLCTFNADNPNEIPSCQL